MATHRETNVRLLPCVLEALARIAVRRGLSRDETVRQVLAEHIAAQEAREPEERLTHISTVLRYPPPQPTGERVDKQLRLRLPPGTVERARAVSLKLPGQHQRAYKDYQARLLTDAVVTAIAVQEPFTDEVLDGLLPVLRHQAALGLWQLVIAATSSYQELRLQDAADHIRARPGPHPAEDERALLIVEALDTDVAWHSRVRFDVALRLATENLRGESAEAFEEMLFSQRTDWAEERLERRFSREAGEWFDGVAHASINGRGATAVWRAQRKVELPDFELWLRKLPVDHPGGRRVIRPPGWSIGVPAEWSAKTLLRGGPLPEPFSQWAAAGQVLVLPLDGRRCVWPLHGENQLPVAGAEPLVAAAAAAARKTGGLVPFVESMLIEWGTTLTSDDFLDGEQDFDGDDPRDEVGDEAEMTEARRRWAEFDARYDAPQLWLPVDQAFDAGLVDNDLRHRAKELAWRENLDRPHRRRTGEALLVAPVVTPDPRICLFVPRTGKERLTKAMWQWEGGSVAAAIAAQAPADVVRCLVDAAVWTTGWTLQRTMHQVWRAVFR